MIYVAFRRTVDRTVFSQLVRVVAGAPVHCVLLAADGTGWEAQQGVGVRPIRLADFTDWELIPVSVEAATALTFCARRVGAKYDYLGAILYGTPLTSRDRWTCSELCAEALEAAGAPLSVLAAGRTPRRLRAWALAQRGRV